MILQLRLSAIVLGLILAFANLPLTTSAQSLRNLDEANGFKDFKFGTPKTTWTGELQKVDIQIANTYSYVGPCCRTAFGFDVRHIRLTFDNTDRLVQVLVWLRGPQQTPGRTKLMNTLRTAFGTETGSDASKAQSGKVAMQWSGRVAGLTFISDLYGAYEDGWDNMLWFSDAKRMSSPADDY